MATRSQAPPGNVFSWRLPPPITGGASPSIGSRAGAWGPEDPRGGWKPPHRQTPVFNLARPNCHAKIDSANTKITFKTDPFDVTFTLDQLPNLRRIVTLGDGNAVAFTAVHVRPLQCARGFLRGVWRHHPERPVGTFFGKYASENGVGMGHVKGFYGINKKGEKVFFGKWISRSGRFRGILRGHWGNGEERAAGWFAGRWIGRDLRVRGELKGEWRRKDECGGGFFRGEWREICKTTF